MLGGGNIGGGNVRGGNVNVGRQGDAVNNVHGDFVKQAVCCLFKEDGNWINNARGCGVLPYVLIAGVLVVGALIAVVFVHEHTKSSHVRKVPVDASLLATADHNSSWPFPSGVFAFGFRQLNNDQFLLCIWYDNIPDKTIVWWANGDRLAPKGSTVKLTARGLVLTSPLGENLWNQTTAGDVAHGVMFDTGNFVLEDDESESLWETFKNPTDTMLPGQTIERGGELFSRQETNYSRGQFQLEFQEDGNLVFSKQKPICSTRTTTGNVPGSEGKQLVFDESGNFYILRVNNKSFAFTDEERRASDFYLRATLNFDGVLALYYLPKSNARHVSWAQLWFEPHKFDSGAGDCADKCSNCYIFALGKQPCEC